MLQAWIASPWGSLYCAAEATPCNVQHLRDHLRGMRRFEPKELKLSVSVTDEDDDAVVEDVSQFLDGLAAEGVEVSLSTGESAGAPVRTRPSKKTQQGSPSESRRRCHVRGR